MHRHNVGYNNTFTTIFNPYKIDRKRIIKANFYSVHYLDVPTIDQ